MQRRTVLHTALGLGAALAGGQASPLARATPELAWRQRSLVGLGTTLSLRAAHADAARVETALDTAVAGIRRVEAAMSLFRPESELSRLNRDGTLDHPSADLLAVLRTAQHVARRSQGAFDATVQPLWAAYAQAQREGRLPTASEVHAARARVDWRQLAVADTLIAFRQAGMAATLNGIAQGYAADVARDALQAHGIAHALLDTGEHSLLGRNDRGQPWTLGIEDPRDDQRLVAALKTDGRALATSADNRTTFSPDHRHHHIFDPATGDSPAELASVSVLAPRAMLADALTKVMFVGGPARIPALAREWQVGVLWIDKAGRWQATPDITLAT